MVDLHRPIFISKFCTSPEISEGVGFDFADFAPISVPSTADHRDFERISTVPLPISVISGSFQRRHVKSFAFLGRFPGFRTRMRRFGGQSFAISAGFRRFFADRGDSGVVSVSVSRNFGRLRQNPDENAKLEDENRSVGIYK